jgi:hypothetical protein
VTDQEWAANYQRLIWTLEIVRDCLNERGQTYRLADVEMAFFMIGKTNRFLWRTPHVPGSLIRVPYYVLIIGVYDGF